MNDPGRPSTLVHLLRSRAVTQSHEPLYIFLADGEAEEFALSYEELDRNARAIAAKLQAVEPPVPARCCCIIPDWNLSRRFSDASTLESSPCPRIPRGIRGTCRAFKRSRRMRKPAFV